MVRVIVKGGDDLSEKKIQDLWLSIDVDRSGEVVFDEFLLWYYNLFGIPSGSLIAKAKRLVRKE